MTRDPRVVSLIPSGTEIVAALGFEAALVGVSHCCDHPAGVRGLPVLSRSKVDPGLGGREIDRGVRALIEEGLSVYEVDVEGLLAARPDVVVTQDHCDACAVSLGDVEEAVRCSGLPGVRICSLNPHDLAAVTGDFRAVADALGVPERGRALVDAFEARIEAVRRRAAGASRPRVALVEWLDPPMIAGGWMPELAWAAGGEPVLVTGPSAFREVTWRHVASEDPDVVVLLPCGFGVERTLDEVRADPEALRWLTELRAFREGRTWIADGDAYFNRPGPRLADSAELLLAVLHPERAARGRPAFLGSRLARADERLGVAARA